LIDLDNRKAEDFLEAMLFKLDTEELIETSDATEAISDGGGRIFDAMEAARERLGVLSRLLEGALRLAL
jgi:hypothetical protein